eukprot:TRINITY_DN7620_c0_g1_i1.p2 TRINITY_DN7620_c0_g1~~TRINITY_DN7620_c0_g1_i1.p2  ORF type:complete len:196 (+),score=21.70 TRINITY_DN7620_c0_g1_i1:1016-1603(+)
MGFQGRPEHSILSCMYPSAIRALYDDNGSLLVNQQEIQQHIIEYFQGQLSHEASILQFNSSILSVGPLISEQQCMDLGMLISLEEIKNAFFSIGIDKSLVPNGLSAKFFKTAWSIIDKDVCTTIKAFFRVGKMPKSINSTIIILIPNHKPIEGFRLQAHCLLQCHLQSKLHRHSQQTQNSAARFGSGQSRGLYSQ